jgi:S1-C subfamily serine protease
MIAGQGSPPTRGRGSLTILTGLLVMLAGLIITWGLGPASPGRASTRTRGGPATVAAIESRVDPAIVDVASTLGPAGSRTGPAEAAGTGIVVTSTGVVVTNNHVIDGATSIRATDIGNGRVYRATVVGYDRSADIAVLQLVGASDLQTADIGNSSKVTMAEPVMALGNAGGTGGTPVAASGAVIGINQSVVASDAETGSRELLSGLIESNADLVAGDSGGPLVNTGGQVIGMDSAASGNSPSQGEGQHPRGYSIPINRAIRLVSKLQAGRVSTTVHMALPGRTAS